MRTKNEIRAYQKQWKENNKEYLRNYMKYYSSKYYIDNKERLKDVRKKWEQENKDLRWSYSKKYRDNNKEKLNKSAAIFRKKYPEIVLTRIKKHNKTIKGRYSGTKSNAYKRGLDFQLEIDFFEKLLNQNCSYCGDGNGYIGIDRINNDLGYLKENVCACCTLCNMMKKTLTKTQFLDHIDKIATFNKTL